MKKTPPLCLSPKSQAKSEPLHRSQGPKPRLAGWFRALAEATGRTPRLAGSGSTWFVEGDAAALGLGGRKWLEVDGQRAPLVATGTSPPGG